MLVAIELLKKFEKQYIVEVTTRVKEVLIFMTYLGLLEAFSKWLFKSW